MTVGFSLALGLADSGTFYSQLQYRRLVSPPQCLLAQPLEHLSHLLGILTLQENSGRFI